VVLPERHDGALHNHQLRLQRDPEDSRPLEGDLWKERGFGWWLLGGLWAAAYNLLLLPTTVVKNIMTFNREQAERVLPTSTTGSASLRTDIEVLPLQGGAGPEGTKTPDEDVVASFPYASAKRQLKQARAMLVSQSREAAEKLERVHLHYEQRLQQAKDAPTPPDRPSAPDA
jgi:hypothetical protein